MERPWLVQRCVVGDNGQFVYGYMGAAEFEVGGQVTSLKKIFVAGIDTGNVEVVVNGKNIPVYMVAAWGFPFAEYQPYLQQIVDCRLNLKRGTHFDDVVKVKAGINSFFGGRVQVNVWFDFPNGVLRTLDEVILKTLVTTLGAIKRKWAKAG